MATHPAFDYRGLTIAERLQLVEDIWDSIAADASPETLPVTDEEKALLDQRLADLEANPDAGASWAEVRARIVNRPR
ncbi:MAG: addiction module protein [Gemmatimonadales bacterium]